MSNNNSNAADLSSRGVVLVSIDGWGISSKMEGNAIANAKTPNIKKLSTEGSYAEIDACGLSVGLPQGVMGNSEVGHLTMGCGRVEFQDLVRINMIAALDNAKAKSGRIHFLGLVSDGGVHSHINHLEAFLSAAQKHSVPQTFVHFFADGRDTPPSSGTLYVKRLQDYMANAKYGKIATVIGRYYAMDRDKRWDRVAIAYEALFAGKGEETDSASLISFIQSKYAAGENDEFLKPIIVEQEGLIKEGDTLLFIDYRSDRMREIVSLFAKGDGAELPFQSSTPLPAALHVSQMTQYDEKWKLPIVFPPQTNVNCLSEWLSKHKVKQFHTAETEKYAHVTFFFNGGKEEAFPLEDRQLIPSPKVATYDLSPPMSQLAVAESVVKAIHSGTYPFIMCNFAAPDMVGHTGVYPAAIEACEVCDVAIGQIATACESAGYTLVITADHGNAEEMVDENGKPKTSHTTNYIPLIIVANGKNKGKISFIDEVEKKKQENQVPVGGLSDIAPTVLTILGLDIPTEMTGHSLVKLVA